MTVVSCGCMKIALTLAPVKFETRCASVRQVCGQRQSSVLIATVLSE